MPNVQKFKCACAHPIIGTYQPRDEKMIIDFSMALDFGSGIVEDQLIDGVNTLFARIAPPVPPASGQFGIFQVVSIPSISTAYVRVSKTGTNLSNNISQDTAFKLKINYFPSANNKDLTYTDGGLLFKNNAYNDNFYYFEIQPTFAVEGLPPFPNIATTLAPLFYEQNPFYNILNLGGADYQSGAVARPSVNFAKTFGMITDVNNALVADPYPRDEIYPTGLVNIVDNTSLTWGEVSGVGQQIYPLKTIQFKRTSAGQLRVFLDNTSTYDLDSVFLLDNSIYISRKNISISNIHTTPTSQLADITELVIMDGQTGIALVKPITNFSEETRIAQQYIKYDLTISVAEILALGSVPTDPILPSGMPPELIYDKIIITGSNQPININEFELYENNLNAMTNASINYIQSTNGTYHGNLINDGSITQRKVVWGTDTLTEDDLTAIVADSSVNPNTITLTETGINYNKVAGSTGKFNFYSHADVSAGGSLNNVQIGSVKGWSSVFTSTSGAIYAPFITIYTKVKGDGSDMASWYNSRYALTESHVDEKIISGNLYTIADHTLSVGSSISPSASPTDIIYLVAMSSGSTDVSAWDINIRSVDMVCEYVDTDLSIFFSHQHNLAITQNAVLHSTFNQVGMTISFYNDKAKIYETGAIQAEGNSYNMKFSLIPANEYTGTITADVEMEEILPFYSGWTKSP